MLENDNYGLYQQCLHCGYIHDLQTVDRLHKKQAKQKREKQAAQHVASEISDNEVRATPQLAGYSQTEYLTFPPSLQSILNRLLKERQNKPHQK